MKTIARDDARVKGQHEKPRITGYAFTVLETPWERYDVHVCERHQLDGSILWGIFNSSTQGSCWTRDRRGFEPEPIPSERTDAWLAKARFTLEEALAEAPMAVEWWQARLAKAAEAMRKLEAAR